MSLNIIIAFVLSFCISTYSIYEIIQFSRRVGLGDDPTEKRKLHKIKIPNLGGVGIFLGAMVAYFTFSDFANVLRPDKIFSVSILLFFLGLEDDMEPVSPLKRMIIEFFCAFFIIYITDVRITNLYGIFYINELNYWVSFALTSVSIVACINAYNMIDGIDGLLGLLALLGATCFGFIFKASGEWLWTLLCVSVVGALVGFLIHNWQPAKIFMGNGGSMFMGILFACFSLRIMQLHSVKSDFLSITMPHTIALAIISIPVFDMVTVFFLRIIHGCSPLKADNRHVHHRLLSLGLQHWQASLVLAAANVMMILFAYFIQDTGALRSLIYTILLGLSLELLLIFFAYRHGKSRDLI